MATHSSVLAWRIPGTGSLVGCRLWGRTELDTTKVTAVAVAASKEIPGLISFWMDWLHLLAVQGTLKSFLQHHSSKASILRHSTFFTVQLSQPYWTTTGKTIALTRGTFVDKVMSLLFSMLSRLVMEKAMAPHSSTLAWKIP